MAVIYDDKKLSPCHSFLNIGDQLKINLQASEVRKFDCPHVTAENAPGFPKIPCAAIDGDGGCNVKGWISCPQNYRVVSIGTNCAYRPDDHPVGQGVMGVSYVDFSLNAGVMICCVTEKEILEENKFKAICVRD